MVDGFEMSGPLFPSLLPRMADPLWFSVDKPCDDEEELSKLEEDQITWLQNIADRDKDVGIIGKAGAEHQDEEEEDDDDGDDNDESESNDDDELDTDMIDDRESPDEADMDGNDVNSDSPPWGL